MNKNLAVSEESPDTFSSWSSRGCQTRTHWQPSTVDDGSQSSQDKWKEARTSGEMERSLSHSVRTGDAGTRYEGYLG